MPHPLHPDDELLAALADDDPEALADSGLTSHVASCDRCGPMVRELRSVRDALSRLPDVAPSRPLQLIPPVPEAAPTRAAWMGVVRRLTAPAIAAGAVLVLVGAIGTASGLGSGAAGGAALDARLGQPASQPSSGGNGVPLSQPAASSSTAAPGTYFGASASPNPERAKGGGAGVATEPAVAGIPVSLFPWLLGIGIALLAAALLARGALRRQESG